MHHSKGKHHHHRDGEMHHHKERHKHKMAHHSEKKEEYSHHEHMVDNRHLKDDHQQGISRVLQRHGDMEVGQHGSMSGGWKHGMHHEVHVPKKG